MTANGDTALLSVRNARKRFGAVTALAGVSLDLHQGEILALLGDNGAGKTTLIKALSGVHQLDAGQIAIDGEPVDFRTPHERALPASTPSTRTWRSSATSRRPPTSSSAASCAARAGSAPSGCCARRR